MIKLKEYRDTAKCLADVLPWAVLVEDGIVMLKSGGFLSAWEYRGHDMGSSGHREMAALAAQVNAALARRGTGWMLHVDAFRDTTMDYPEVRYFPERTSWVIDEERRNRFEDEGVHYESRYVFTLTYTPYGMGEQIGAFMIDTGGREDPSANPSLRALDTFKKGVQDVEGALQRHLRPKRLCRDVAHDKFGNEYYVDNLLRHLNMCVTGETHPVRLPRFGGYLDAIIGGKDMRLGYFPRIGNKHIRVIGMMGFPHESYPGILDFLNHLAMTYRWSTRAIFLDATDAESEIEKYRRNWSSRIKSFFNSMREQLGKQATHLNSFAIEMAKDTLQALDENSSGSVKFLYYTGTIVLMDEDESKLDEQTAEVVKQLNECGFPSQVETVNAVNAFLGSLPGNGYANVRRPLMHSLNLADLMPLTSVSTGLATNPCAYFDPGSPPLLYAATTGCTPYRLNLHVGDIGHTAILGPTGAGKSTLLALIAAQFLRYRNAQVFVFDKGYSTLPLGKAIEGADHYDINGDSETLTFCPLAGVDDPAERAWAMNFVESLLVLQNVPVTPEDKRDIRRALELLAKERTRTITTFAAKVQNQKVKDALETYRRNGPLRNLLDSPSDGLKDGFFQVFEMEHLLPLKDQYVVPVLNYLFHRIEKRVMESRPTLIILDEAWTMLKNPFFADRIEDWLRTMRKKNCSVVFATQSLADVLGANSTLRSVIAGSCPTKIFLPNPEATNEDEMALYKGLGLSEFEVKIIQGLTQKLDYYYVSPNGRRPFQLDLGPLALSFVGASGGDDLKRIRQLSSAAPSSWVVQWLKERGLPKWAAYWLTGNPDANIDSMLASINQAIQAQALRNEQSNEGADEDELSARGVA